MYYFAVLSYYYAKSDYNQKADISYVKYGNSKDTEHQHYVLSQGCSCAGWQLAVTAGTTVRYSQPVYALTTHHSSSHFVVNMMGEDAFYVNIQSFCKYAFKHAHFIHFLQDTEHSLDVTPEPHQKWLMPLLETRY